MGVVGAGLMAAQIGVLLAGRLGVPVVLRDLDDERVAAGLAAVRAAVERQVRAGRLDEAAGRALVGRVTGTTTLDAWSPSKEGTRLACQLSSGGDEESLLHVLDVETGALLDGPVDRCRSSPVAWVPGGEAFFYVRRLPPEQVRRTMSATRRALRSGRSRR